MESSSQDRNLPASARKLQKARSDGQVTRSRDLAHLVALGTGALCLLSFGSVLFDQLQNATSLQLLFDAATLKNPQVMLDRMQTMVALGLIASVLFALVINTASILSTVAAGSWVFSLTPLMPDFSHLNPISGLGRLFTKERFFEVLKVSFIATMMLVISYNYLASSMGTLSALVLQPSTKSIGYLANWLQTGLGLLLLVVLLVAVVDFPLQKYLFMSRLKMSHQEMRQENKESEGSPEMKNRRRQRQREIAHGNSIKAVPKADFVLMNPTHYAVAVQYDDKAMHAPRVIAKGADLLAFRIRDKAKESAIPVLQSAVLARALYANAELDQDIPTSLYTAVAQVLAYIYRLKAAMRGDGPMPGEPPVPFVPPELDPLSKVVNATAMP